MLIWHSLLSSNLSNAVILSKGILTVSDSDTHYCAMTEEKEKAKDPAIENGPGIYKVKVDHFEGINILGEENKVDGAPNFRQVFIN